MSGLLRDAIGTPMGDFITNAIHAGIDICGEMRINEYLGNRNAQIVIEDVRKHGGSLI